MDLIHYDCITAAGLGSTQLFNSLVAGIDFSKQISNHEWSIEVPSGGRVCQIQHAKEKFSRSTYQKAYEFYLAEVWDRFYKNLSIEQTIQLKKDKTLVVLASTKGAIEDYIWSYKNDAGKARTAPDPFNELNLFFKNKYASCFGSLDSVVISNACASSHVAFEFAESQLKYHFYDSVLVIAADLVGPFIYQGFFSLKVLSLTRNKPFAAERDGLQLGEALAILLFSASRSNSNSNSQSPSNIRVSAACSDTEGGSVTRPSNNGESLYRALEKVKLHVGHKPDFIIAHGTGTKFNDSSEEKALQRFCTANDFNCPISGIKWSVGHTLGASGALDLIAACEVMKNKKVFRLANSSAVDPEFRSSILTKDCVIPLLSLRRVMITSLGFGGVHAALMVEAPQ